MRIFIAVLSFLFMLQDISSQTYDIVYPIQENFEKNMNIYDAKKNHIGHSTLKYKELKTLENGQKQINIVIQKYDTSNNIVENRNFFINFNDTALIVDAKSMSDNFNNASKGAELTEENIIYPKLLNAGDKLPDAKLSIKKQNVKQENYYDIVLNNRQVESHKNIDINGVVYNCLRIKYNLNVSFKIMGMNRSMTFEVVEYYFPKIGLVKADTYNENGKLLSSTILNNYK